MYHLSSCVYRAAKKLGIVGSLAAILALVMFDRPAHGFEEAGVALTDETASEVFARRIEPILNSANPSSCVECHLSGVELKDYIRPTQEATFVALRDSGMIDLDKPEQSKLLELIRMGGNDEAESKRATSIDPKIRAGELEAFSSWITAAVKDDALRALPTEEDSAILEHPLEVIRHNRIDRVTDSFVDNIWSLRFRCMNCHMESGHNFVRLSEEYGADEMEWMFQDDPESTVRYLIDEELVDLENPANSLLLLKPLNEVEHGGGIKMERNDTDYMAFLGWIEDLSKSVNNQYTDVASLPKVNHRNGSEIWARFENLPQLLKGETGFITLHRASDSGWNDAPAAIASFNARVNRRFGVFAQGFLMIETPDGSPADELPGGSYQLRLHIDPKNREEISDFDAALAKSKEVARTVVDSEWPRGWGKTTVAQAEINSRRLVSQFPAFRDKRVAMTKIQMLDQARKIYLLDLGEEPTSIKQFMQPEGLSDADSRRWRGPYLAEEPRDPWGNEYKLELRQLKARTQTVISSPGPDGEFGTQDDIIYRPGIG